MAANSCRQGTYPVVVGMHVVLCRADLVNRYKVQWLGQCTSDIVPLFARIAANSPACADGIEQMWFGHSPVCANGSKQPCSRKWQRTDVVWGHPCLHVWQQTALVGRMAANRCGLGAPLFARMAANSPGRANGSEQMWFGWHETLNIRCVIEASLEIVIRSH